MVNVVDPETPPRVAVIVTDPGAFAVASPPPLWPLLMVARFADDVLQCADLVKSWVVPSAKYPVAENCRVWPTFIVGSTGVTTMPSNVWFATFSVVLALKPPIAAVIVTIPGFRPVTRPVESTEAIVLSVEDQAASAETSWVVLSL